MMKQLNKLTSVSNNYSLTKCLALGEHFCNSVLASNHNSFPYIICITEIDTFLK